MRHTADAECVQNGVCNHSVANRLDSHQPKYVIVQIERSETATVSNYVCNRCASLLSDFVVCHIQCEFVVRGKKPERDSPAYSEERVSQWQDAS